MGFLKLSILGFLFALFSTFQTSIANAKTSAVRSEFEQLKTPENLDIQTLNSKMANLTDEEFELVLNRLKSDLIALPDIYDPSKIDDQKISEIGFLIQVVFARGHKDFISDLKIIKNLAARKLYSVEAYNELWTYQLDHVIGRSYKELMVTKQYRVDGDQRLQSNIDLAAKKSLEALNTYLILSNLRIQRYTMESQQALPMPARFTKTERDGDINLEEIDSLFTKLDGMVLIPKRKLILPEFEIKPIVDYTDSTALDYKRPNINYNPKVQSKDQSTVEPSKKGSAQIIVLSDYRSKRSTPVECKALF